ncbi:MAG: hypothetical protein KDD45_09795 [Bdellovibrionales bacterium]|nr:hypothetical protein [Bdellovibrionales bacterium]
MSEEKTIIKKKRSQNSSRLTLSSKAQRKTSNWINQIEQKLNGMISIKRNDLLNFLLEEMDDNLASSVLDKIKKEKLTGKQKAKWIYQKFLEAEKSGSNIDFDDLVKVAQEDLKKQSKRKLNKNKSHQSSLSKPSENDPLIVK